MYTEEITLYYLAVLNPHVTGVVDYLISASLTTTLFYFTPAS